VKKEGLFMTEKNNSFHGTRFLKFAFESSKDSLWLATLLGSEKSAESIPPVSKKKILSDTLNL
jgi:hypothetical protein